LAGRAIVDDEADLTDAVSKSWMAPRLARDGSDIFLGFYNEFSSACAISRWEMQRLTFQFDDWHPLQTRIIASWLRSVRNSLSRAGSLIVGDGESINLHYNVGLEGRFRRGKSNIPPLRTGLGFP
jgi:hypothetical protein